MSMAGVRSDRVSLSLDPSGALVGCSASGGLLDNVTVAVDGHRWATVPSVLTGERSRSFRCDLPWDSASEREASVLDIFGNPIASLRFRPPPEPCNGRGLGAGRVLALHSRPFYAVPYISFDGAIVTLVGAHLPPGGDPGSLRVEFGPGVSHRFKYPVESESWRSHFWYWPNALFSDFVLTIDLASSNQGSDPFTFRFVQDEGPGAGLPEPHGRVWIPSDLFSHVGFPQDLTQLTRVQTWSDSRSVALTGYNAFRAMEALFARHGVAHAAISVMDWGCGHGRVSRHFIREWPGASIIGMDVDAENAGWAAAHLSPGQFVASPLMPPCSLPNSCLDALFSISVMTHLPATVQQAWLEELARLMRPGAIALISFGGPAAVAWSSIWHEPSYLDLWEHEGIHADQVDAALDGKIGETSYYRNAAQSHRHVLENWSYCFDVVEIVPEAIGNLDFAVLRRK